MERCHVITSLLLLFVHACLTSPIWEPQFLSGGSGRNIRHLPCVSRRTGESGVCMFAFSCLKSNGTHLGTCIDRFYFGSCCQLPHDYVSNNTENNHIPQFPPSFPKPSTIGRPSSSETVTRLPVTNKQEPSSTPEPEPELIKIDSVSNIKPVKNDPVSNDNTVVAVTKKPIEYTKKPVTKPVTKPIVEVPSTTEMNYQLSTFQSVQDNDNTVNVDLTSPSPLVTSQWIGGSLVTVIKLDTTTEKAVKTTAKPLVTSKPAAIFTKPARPNDPTVKPPAIFTKPTKPSDSTAKPPAIFTKPTKPNDSTSKPPAIFTKPARPNDPTVKPPAIFTKPTKPNDSTAKPPAIFTKPTKPNDSTSKPPAIFTKPTKPNDSTAKPPAIFTKPARPNDSTAKPAIFTKPARPNDPTVKPPAIFTRPTKPTDTPTRPPPLFIKPIEETSSKPPAIFTKPTKPSDATSKPPPKPTKPSGTQSKPAATTPEPAVSTSKPNKPKPPASDSSITSSKPSKPVATTTTTSKPTKKPPTKKPTVKPTTTTEEDDLTYVPLITKPETTTKKTVAKPTSPKPTTTSKPTSKPRPSSTPVPLGDGTIKPSTKRPPIVVLIGEGNDVEHSSVAPGLVTWTNMEPSSSQESSSASAVTTDSEEDVDLTVSEEEEQEEQEEEEEEEDNKTTPRPSSQSSNIWELIPDPTPPVQATAVTEATSSGSEAVSEEVSIEEELTTPAAPLDTALNMSDFRDVCGRRLFPEARVVGGEKATFGKWPWQISLRQWRTSTYLHKCGAALLNENWAITAAHCVENVPPSDLLLRLGEHDLSTEEEPYGYQERRVQIVASHPQFDPRTFEYDLALLRFYEPVSFQPNILPVCVPQDDTNFVGKTAHVTGWGRLYEDGPLPSVLQEVTVPVINNTLCETMYRSAGYIEHIPNIFICAGWKKGGFDSCEGDSGGPMVIQRPDRRWLLAGVISWGIGCAEPNQPGVYTRISEFREWINQILQF